MFNKRTPADNSAAKAETSPSPARHSETHANQDNEISVAGLTDSHKAQMSKSVIDEWLVMKGDLESEGDILVKGKVIGNVRCKMLIIDEKAVIEGGVNAEEVIIRGTTKGEVRAKRVRLQSTAKVLSEIVHESFSAEEGAYIEGALRHLDNADDETTNAASPTPKARKKTDKPSFEVSPNQPGHVDPANGGVTHN